MYVYIYVTSDLKKIFEDVELVGSVNTLKSALCFK